MEKKETVSLKPELILAGLALGLGAFFAWYVYSLKLVAIVIDQYAHLNISRQVIDSMTPGITQFGFWPPLLHAIMFPFTAVDFLYQTGLAGAAALVPILALGTYFLYKILWVFTRNVALSFIGALIFLINPYVLYYSVTPMTEVLFIAMLFGSVYFLMRWFEKRSYNQLVITAIFIVLASLARFEGLVLIPLAGAIILFTLFKERRPYQEIEATAILFFFVAILGATAIISYSWFFGNDPFAFMSSNWSAFSQQQDYLRPAEGSFWDSIRYLLHASYYMFGKPLVILSFLSFAAIVFIYPRKETIGAGLMLISPFIFNLFALYQGTIVIYVDELPPFNWFFNERYALYSIGFVIFAPVVLARLGLGSIRHGRAEKMILGALVLLPLLLLQVFYTFQVAIVDQFEVVRLGAEKSERMVQNQLAAARFIQKNYDHGKILMTRATNDIIAQKSGVPIREYIYESNFPYYEEALEAPWLFARFVVMLNPGETGDEVILEWVKANERVSQRWGNSKSFNQFYDKAFENQFVRIYKIDQKAVENFAARQKIATKQIPSLNGADWWEADYAREKLGLEDLALFATFTLVTEEDEKKVGNDNNIRTHEVKRGETLSFIAERYYGAGIYWAMIAEANDIKNPDLIHAGQFLKIPIRTP